MFRRQIARIGQVAILFAALAACHYEALPTPEAAQSLTEHDYLSANLRAQVERLKQDQEAIATDASNVRARARTLFDWANAMASTGRSIPVNLTLMVSFAMHPGPPTSRTIRSIDEYIQELALYDESPESLGTVTVDRRGPFPVSSYQTITQTYTVGQRPITIGGGIVVGRHHLSDGGKLQGTQPAEINFVSARSSNPTVQIEVSGFPLRGMFGGFFGSSDTLFFKVIEGQLEPGDRVTIELGDVSQGSPGLKMQSFSNAGLRLPLFVMFAENEPLFSLPEIFFITEGGPVARVKGFAPSIVNPDEAFEISVRGEDIYRNRATGVQPAYDVFINGFPHGQIDESNEAVSRYPLTLSREGVYRITFRSRDGKITGASNPILVREGSERIYWGETHAHSAFAEGQGTIEEFFNFGRDDAALDFLGMSEHDIWLDDYEWSQMIDYTEAFNDPGSFVTFLSYEWTAPTEFGGHHNVFFRTARNRNRAPTQYYPTLGALYKALRDQNDPEDVLIIPHAHQAADYRLSDGQMENVVEIMSLHGTFEWFGRAYLSQGHEVGFIAASDDHFSHPGYGIARGGRQSARSGLAAVFAQEKTRDSIFGALKSRATYATTGERIILDYDFSGGKMGQRIEATNQRELSLSVYGTAPLDQISVIKNGEEVHTEHYLLDRSGASNHLAIGFQSSSDPVVRDNARGWRVWRGTLSVSGADLIDYRAPATVGAAHSVVAPGDAPNTLDFVLRTRGNVNNLYLTLDNKTPGTVIRVELEPTREIGSPLRLSDPGDHPSLQINLALSDLKSGRSELEVPGVVLPDQISLSTVKPDAPTETVFNWTDRGATSPGDHYFVRVTQQDGSMAWTSPVWVGGLSPTGLWGPAR